MKHLIEERLSSMEHEKGISLITDFGCLSSCPYCIWRNHKKYRHNPENQIKTFLGLISSGNRTLRKFSLSGGGDPLNLHPDRKGFYDAIHKICKKHGLVYDIHTSYSVEKILEFFEMFPEAAEHLHRIVFHASRERIPFVSSLSRFKELLGRTRLRIVYVVSEELDLPYLREIEESLSRDFPEDVQLSYRELVGERFRASEEVQSFCETVSERRKTGKYINQKDYNVYIMPDGTTTETFLE